MNVLIGKKYKKVKQVCVKIINYLFIIFLCFDGLLVFYCGHCKQPWYKDANGDTVCEKYGIIQCSDCRRVYHVSTSTNLGYAVKKLIFDENMSWLCYLCKCIYLFCLLLWLYRFLHWMYMQVYRLILQKLL